MARTCKECARLRKKLSPLEDAAFTAEFVAREPTLLEFYVQKTTLRDGALSYIVTLRPLWLAAFGTDPTPLELTKLGRTLAALGWERTKRNGLQFFCLPVKEFDEVYRNG